jgi:sugar lactone lactonase YvrE
VILRLAAILATLGLATHLAAAGGGFEYWLQLARAPRITSISPDSGPISGGTEVTLRGANLASAQISIDGVPTAPIAQSATQVRVRIPAGANGYVTLSAGSTFGKAYAEFVREPPRLADLPMGTITTVAGAGTFYGSGRPATQAMVEPTDIALGARGEIFLAEPGLALVRRIRTDGLIENFAGTGIEGRGEDNVAALRSQLWQARGIALDSAGNLYLAESWSHRVRRVDAATGIITTIAGTGEAGFAGDGGPARSARLNYPVQLAFDPSGNLYVLECGNSRVRRIGTAGTITTVAGNGVAGFSGDGGPATAASINIGNGVFVDVGGIAVDPSGNVYIADTNNSRVRRVDGASGTIRTVAEAPQVRAVATDAHGNVFYAANDLGDPRAARITKLDPQMRMVATFGRGTGASADGGPAAEAPLGFIDRVRVDAQGNILFTDFTVLRVRRINAASGGLETVAGIGPGVIGDNGPAIRTVLGIFNSDIAFDAGGGLLIADDALHRIRRLAPDGRISHFAGLGVFGVREIDGVPAADAAILGPRGLHVKADGSVLVVSEHALRTIGTDGIIRLTAGNEFRQRGYAGDGGPAVGAQYMQMHDAIADSAGNIFIADANNNRVRRVDAATGIVTTVAGSGPVNGLENYGAGTTCGDGGPALSACINTPYGVAVDPQGNLLISENWQRIRKVDRNGVITTLAQVYSTKMAVDAAGNVFVVGRDRILRISPQGFVTTIAGRQGEPGFSGDGGPALSAQIDALGQASGIAIAPNGDLYFSDGGNRRIRAIKGGALLP